MSISIYKKMINSLEDSTPNAYLDLLHPDYIFVRHQSGEEVSKEDWAITVTDMYSAKSEGKITFTDNRCLYENDDILVVHNIVSFPDGTREAVMGFHSLKDGKIIRSESGATPLK
mgnify:FL=1